MGLTVESGVAILSLKKHVHLESGGSIGLSAKNIRCLPAQGACVVELPAQGDAFEGR